MDAPDAQADTSSIVAAFWEVARVRAKLNPTGYYTGERPEGLLPPPAWAFGATPDEADALLALVLSGDKTATAGALWDYGSGGESRREPGALAVDTSGGAVPHAHNAATRVDVVPFDEVSAEHAFLEGEGDRSLATWRQVHERFFTESAVHDRGFRSDMPVVLQRFTVLYRHTSAAGTD